MRVQQRLEQHLDEQVTQVQQQVEVLLHGQAMQGDVGAGPHP